MQENPQHPLRTTFRHAPRRLWIVIVVGVTLPVCIAWILLLVPSIHLGGTTLANENSVVRLTPGKIVRLKTADVSVYIKGFTNDTCPETATCFGSSEPAVEYILTVNGKGYATGSQNISLDSGYTVETTGSDYSTYADIIISRVSGT